LLKGNCVFALKKLLGGLLMLLPFAALLVVAGIMAWRLRRGRLARVVLIAAGALVFAASLRPVGDGLLRPLEYSYHATLDATTIVPAPEYVVVLGGAFAPSVELPVTAALEPDAVVRLAEGIRLLRQLPGARLIVSGGAVNDNPPSARGYARAAIALGVPASSIIILDEPRDTGAEINAIHSLIGDATVLLVTSAVHMPRAMAHCTRTGLHAIAAPTGNRTRSPGSWTLNAWVPSGSSLRNTELAMHEYFGLLALSLGVT
jgi:uncharacterized SAM-binding protein YcdF (DUF218 family)